MPVFNELATVEQAVRRVMELKADKELIVVDDFSTDGSRELLKKLWDELKFKLILRKQNLGKGAAVRFGVAHAKGEFLIVEDADLELDIKQALEMVSILEKTPEAKLINGNRDIANDEVHLITRIARFVVYLCTLFLYGRRIRDILCAYKICRVSDFKQLNIQTNRFGFETEWIAKAIKQNWKIMEYRIKYFPRHKSHKKIHIFDGVDIIWQLIKFRFKS